MFEFESTKGKTARQLPPLPPGVDLKKLDEGIAKAFDCPEFGESKVEPPPELHQKRPENSAPPEPDNTENKDRYIRMQGAADFVIDPRIRRSEPQPLFPPSVSPYTPRPEEIATKRRPMAAIDDDRIIQKKGTRYFPLALAAQHGQVPRTTLLDWIKARTAVQGRQLQVYDSPTAHKSFLAEESVERLAERFIKWRNGQPAGPAGPVTIGKTNDKSGYVGINKAAKDIGVTSRTMWLWTTQEDYTSPGDETLDVIRCTASQQFYISERDVARLKKLVPKSGLRRGRRPQLDLQA